MEEVKTQLTKKDQNQDQLLSEFQELQKSINDINKTISKKEQEASSYKSKLLGKDRKIEAISYIITKQKNKINWGLYSILLIVGSLFIWFLEEIVDWPWFVTHNKIMGLKILTNLIIIIALLNISLRKHWIIWLGVSVTIMPGLAILKFAF